MDEFLESRLARLQSDVADIRSDVTEMKWREERAKLDRQWRRDMIADFLWMLLQTAIILAALTGGFK